MSPVLNKFLSLDVLALFLSFISLLRIGALALETTSVRLSAGNVTDLHALLAFKSNILPDHREALSSWNESLHFCEWEGVQCSRRHQRVTALDLRSGGLIGILSPHIGNLSFLRGLFLFNNSLFGEIPSELGNLFRLQKLLLYNNNFEGIIPVNLSRCSNLIQLSVGKNNLVGEFPKQLTYSMLKLKILSIHQNKLTGGIPTSIGNLTSLESFSTGGNPFGGTIPDTLGQVKNLTWLGLGGTQIFDTIPPSIYNLSSLTVFSVSYNQLRGNLPSSFGFMFPHLQILQLSMNKFTGPLPISLSNCSQLIRLELNDNRFSGKFKIDFRNIQNINHVVANDNSLGSGDSDELAFLSSFTNCSNFEALEMSSNQLRGELPDYVGNLSSNLYWLSLRGNQLYGHVPSSLRNLVNLTHLNMESNQFTGPIPDSIGYLTKLHRLCFSNNKLSGKITNSLGNLSLLNELYLGENRLEGTIPSSLGNCQNLLRLELFGNNLSGSIPKQLLTISSLSVLLDLSNNRLSGPFPTEVKSLKNLAKIDVSKNGLSGDIPSTLGTCTSLENLHMQQNFFQGHIPPSFESLKGIQHLDLSHNNLSGRIPAFLGTSSLKTLNLSFNDFEGELPMKGVFTNASTISIIGNPRLCGGIPELQLPRCTNKKSKNKMLLSQTLEIAVASVLVGVTLLLFSIMCWFKKKKGPPTVSLPKESFLKVTYGELLKATNGFSLANLLGFGNFGRVYRGNIDRGGELVVAVKVLHLQTRGALKSFMAECEALRNIRHRNLVRVITSCSSVDFQGNEFKALVYKFMPNGSLEKWLHPSTEANNEENGFHRLNLLQRLNIAMDVACALDYLHHQCQTPIVHCDLKPSNILLDSDLVAHVGDFGLARFRTERSAPSQSSSTAMRGTIGYAAPEYGLGNDISTGGDVYSYGILLLEMITGKKPTEEQFEGDLNLHNFVMMALPQRAIEIIDPVLLSEEENDSKTVECLILVIHIGLACSKGSPHDRMSISEILHELHLATKKICEGQHG